MTNPMTNPTGTTIRLIDHGTAGDALPATLVNAYGSLTVPAYWRAMNFISENMAAFPRAVYVDGARSADAHPLDALLRLRPNGYQNAVTFWRTLFFHMAHAGNGYALVQRDPRGRPVALHNRYPEDVTPFRVTRDDGDGNPDQFYALHARAGKVIVPGADVIHMQGLSHDGMRGTDPVAMHEGTLQRGATLDRYQTRFLMRGTVMRGSIEFPSELSPEQLQQLRAYLTSHFFGTEATQDVLILTGGAKLNNTTLSPQASQLIEQSAHTTKQIAQVTGVPPEFLFEKSESKYTGIEEAGENVTRYLFRPLLVQAEAELTIKLLSPADQAAGQTVRLNPDALIRGSTKAQVDAVVAKVNAGIETANEGRGWLGQPPIADRDADKLKRTGDTSPPPQTPPV